MIKKFLKLKNIILIGPPAVGKTSVGLAISNRLSKSFYDIDEYIVSHQKLTVDEIFVQYGEAYFRNLESEAILNLSKLNDIVLATGGGAILNSTNRNVLTNSGAVVYLYAKGEVLYRRILQQNNRPKFKNLLGDKLKLEIQHTLEVRDNIYNSIADVKINITNLTIEEVVIKILNYLIKL